MRGEKELVWGENVYGLRVYLSEGNLHNNDYILDWRFMEPFQSKYCGCQAPLETWF